MSPPDHNAPTRPPAALADARLAHELAGLLDGGLRNLQLAMSRLRETSASGIGNTEPRQRGEDLAGVEPLLERLDAANHAMQQMAALIQRWRHVAPGQPIAIPHSRRTLGEIVEHTLRLLLPAAEGRGIELRATLSDRAAALPAGPLYPVIANALRNAIEALAGASAKAAAPAGRIDIEARLDGDQVVLSIRDDGPGLSPELFDPQGRLRFGHTTKPDGHGFGLSLSRDIARSLGGTLELVNRSPRGAELILTYPVASVESIADV